MNATKSFEILRLEEDASLVEAKQAYRRLVKRWHPDQYENDSERKDAAQRKLTEINVAYREVVSMLKTSPPKPVPATVSEKETSEQGGLAGDEKNKKDSVFRRFASLFRRKGDDAHGEGDTLSSGKRSGAPNSSSSAEVVPDFQKILKHAVRRQPGRGGSGAHSGKRRRQYAKKSGPNASRRPVMRSGGSRSGRIERIKPVKRVGKI